MKASKTLFRALVLALAMSPSALWAHNGPKNADVRSGALRSLSGSCVCLTLTAFRVGRVPYASKVSAPEDLGLTLRLHRKSSKKLRVQTALSFEQYCDSLARCQRSLLSVTLQRDDPFPSRAPPSLMLL